MVESQLDSQNGSTGMGVHRTDAGYAFRMWEGTPLYRRPDTCYSLWRKVSGAAICMLLGLMVVGVIFGGYMLQKQGHEDAVVGPCDESVLHYVCRREWSDLSLPVETYPRETTPAKHVVLVQTGTSTCDSFDRCASLLNEIMAETPEPIPYNFFLSSNGMTFEWLGWRAPSPLYPQLAPMVVAFIGSFEEDIPSVYQMLEAISLLDESVLKGFLIPNFSIVGKVTKRGEIPTYLFNSVMNMKQWNAELSDDF